MTEKKIKSLKILIVAGGWSDEREISLLSGKNIFFPERSEISLSSDHPPATIRILRDFIFFSVNL